MIQSCRALGTISDLPDKTPLGSWPRHLRMTCGPWPRPKDNRMAGPGQREASCRSSLWRHIQPGGGVGSIPARRQEIQADLCRNKDFAFVVQRTGFVSAVNKGAGITDAKLVFTPRFEGDAVLGLSFSTENLNICCPDRHRKT